MKKLSERQKQHRIGYDTDHDQPDDRTTFEVGLSDLLVAENGEMVNEFAKWWLTRRPSFANDKNGWLKVDVRNAFCAFKNGYKAAQKQTFIKALSLNQGPSGDRGNSGGVT